MAQKQSTLLPALSFGLVGIGFGAVVGIGIIYTLRKIENQSKSQDATLKKIQAEIIELKSQIAALNNVNYTPGPSSSGADKRSQDEDEYLTADEEDDEEEEPELQVTRQSTPTYKAGGDANEFFEKIDAMLEGDESRQHQAYILLQQKEHSYKKSSEFLWRMAKATHFEGTVGKTNGNKKLQQELYDKAYSIANKSVKYDDFSANAHKWLAITCGARSEFLGTNDKIQSGYTFKSHVDRAISLNPKDSTCYYLLGRFCYDVANLSWIERKVASALFSTPPFSTIEEALGYFIKSESLSQFMDNRYYLAKCYYELGNIAEAINWLDKAATMPCVTATDKVSLENVKILRSKISPS